MLRRKGAPVRREEGITGIETAIILIAFVIVASVFAYVALSAGLFSTQEAKEAIYSGLDEAKSTIEIKGNVYGKMEDSVLTEIYFTIATTTSGFMINRAFLGPAISAFCQGSALALMSLTFPLSNKPWQKSWIWNCQFSPALLF